MIIKIVRKNIELCFDITIRPLQKNRFPFWYCCHFRIGLWFEFIDLSLISIWIIFSFILVFNWYLIDEIVRLCVLRLLLFCCRLLSLFKICVSFVSLLTSFRPKNLQINVLIIFCVKYFLIAFRVLN